MLLAIAIVAAFLWLPSPVDWIVVGLVALVEVGEVAFWLRWSGRRHARVGAETLVGRRAVVAQPCRPEGQIRIDGELWRARCEEGAGTGDAVVVEGRDGLTLVVRRA